LRASRACDKNFCFENAGWCDRAFGEILAEVTLEQIDRADGRRADTPMPLHESEAIILQSYPLGEGDRLVSFLSRGAGRMRGVAKGARRPKSRFGSTLERLSHIRIWYFERETRDLVRITQSELIESFLAAFSDYESGVALGLLSEISEVVLPEHEALDAPFRLLLLTAKAIKKTGKPAVPLAYFCIWTLKLAGWMPPLDSCVACGTSLSDAAAYVSPSLQGLACARCKPPSSHLLPKEPLAIARRMLVEKLDALLEASLPPLAIHELTATLLDWIELQAEKRLTSRKLWEQKI
jgi:DNA repair protein RecO (recombination protein O)